MSAEIPGMVSPAEIEAANAAVIIERDALASVLKELQAENAKLRACVELLADENNWASTNDGPTVKAVVFAQQCLEELKLTNPNQKEK